MFYCQTIAPNLTSNLKETLTLGKLWVGMATLFFNSNPLRTRAGRTTGARGINFLASSNKYQIASIIQKTSAKKVTL